MNRDERTSRRFRRVALHLTRVLLFVLVIVLIHLQHRRLSAQQQSNTPLTEVEIESLRRLFPAASSVSEQATSKGGYSVLDADGNALGYILQTSPQADHLIGFSGPTNTLIAFSPDDQVVGIDVLSSGDTRDHLKQVVQDSSFMTALNGKSWDEVASGATQVDGVSGATLTSLAIRESILCRLGDGNSDTTSLRFPSPMMVADAQRLFPAATRVTQDEVHPALWHAFQDGSELGTVLRTSPSADNTIGYQGPTETLIGFGTDHHVVGITLRKSYDNEPYVTYVREDANFLARFNELVLDELADLDPVATEIEGVSGATMTSMAVTDGLILAAQQQRAAQQAAAAANSNAAAFHWKLRDFGTAAVILLGLIVAFTSLRGNSTVRIGFQLVLILYLGLVNGDLVSQAMLVGWAQNGVPWTRAGGLVLLTAAAFMVPITTRRNVYCSHLCPHGAAQHLLKDRLPWRWKIPAWLKRILRLIPAMLLAWCVIVAMTSLTFSLVDIEPFDAWVFRIAGVATIVIAIVGLVASLFVPMAYCHYGCPTGALLNFLRFNSRSDRWARRDWFAVGLVALACGFWLTS